VLGSVVRLVIVGIPHDSRNLGPSESLHGRKATMPCDQFVLIASDATNDHGLQ
jgi:hypothetical protein